MTKRSYLRLVYVGFLILFAAYVLQMIRTAWICDDAYITLRTVDNFIHGFGLRWNIASRVQSYTHPLWMLLQIPMVRLFADEYHACISLCLFFSTGTFLLFLLFNRRRPAAALVGGGIILCSIAYMDFSSSGLEDPLSHFLLVLFMYCYFRKPCSPGHVGVAFLVVALLGMTRLDVLLLVFLPALHLLWSTVSAHEKDKLSILWYVTLGMMPLVLWEAFSLVYYGAPFPNTAYSKLWTGIGRGELMQQGLRYCIDSLQNDPITIVTILYSVILAALKRKKAYLLLASGSLIYCAYVVYIGGDFMSGRFFTAPLLVSAYLVVVMIQRPWESHDPTQVLFGVRLPSAES